MLFNDFKDKYNQYKTKLISYEDFDSWVYENVEITNYISIINKYVMLHDINEAFTKDYQKIMSLDKDNMEIAFVIYDIATVMDILFRYTNIDVSIDQRTTENYDFMMSSGLFKYLRDKIGPDYDKFISMFEKASGINEINTIKVIAKFFESSISGKDVENLEKMFKSMTPKKIKLLEEFQAFNNPGMKSLYDNMKNSALNKANEEIKSKNDNKG